MHIFSPSKSLGTFFGIIMLLAGIFMNTACSADYLRIDRDIAGKIVDSDTQKPIPGVVIMVMWRTYSFRLTIEPDLKYYDYVETLSDKDGEFRIPGKGLNIFRDIAPPVIKIYKSGYSSLYLHDLGTNFRRDSRFSSQVEWIDGKPIISFKKKSLEERKKSIPQHQKVPFYEMGEEGVSSKKYCLYKEEVRREYKALGMTSMYDNDRQYLYYKRGGIFPSAEKAVKPGTKKIIE